MGAEWSSGIAIAEGEESLKVKSLISTVKSNLTANTRESGVAEWTFDVYFSSSRRFAGETLAPVVRYTTNVK